MRVNLVFKDGSFKTVWTKLSWCEFLKMIAMASETDFIGFDNYAVRKSCIFEVKKVLGNAYL